jgi:hypothetical protein
VKPLLASEVLASERAPLEPGRSASRFQLGMVAVTLVGVGLAMQVGVGPSASGDAATVAFCAAGMGATLAILPFPYALRAAVSLLVGGVLMLLGLRGSGPLAGLAVDGGEMRDLVRILTVTLLPGALLLRARYASFAPTRWILAGALVASVPFGVLEVTLATAADVAMVTKIAAVCAAGAVAAGVFALFGDGSLGSRSPVAWLILIVLPAEIGIRELTPLADAQLSGWLTYPTTAVVLFCAALLTSHGTYQLAAVFLGPRAQEALRKKLLSGGETRNPPLNLVKR